MIHCKICVTGKIISMSKLLKACMLWFSVASSAWLQAAGGEFTPGQLQFFETRIRPLLAEKCYKCHSHKARKLKGGLYLDSRPGVLKGGDTGPSIMPGKSGDWRLGSITPVRLLAKGIIWL